MLKFNFYGHACFLLDDGKYKVLFDPFLTGNPQAAIKAADVKADYVFVTHAHSDHLGDAYDILIKNNATAVGIPEVGDLVGDEVKTIGMNLGGTLKLPFGFARMVPAMHSSGVAGGTCCGYVINMGGKIIYFAGDTCLFGDMKLIGERDKIDYAVLPIGGHFTMDAYDAARAVEFLGAKNVIPVHYDTWQPIEQDAEEFKNLVKGAAVHIVKPGESLELA